MPIKTVVVYKVSYHIQGGPKQLGHFLDYSSFKLKSPD